MSTIVRQAAASRETLVRPDLRPGGRRLWAYVLAGGAAAIAAYFLLPTILAKDLWYQSLGLLAVVAAIVGVVRNRPARMLPWAFIVAAMISYVMGDITWTVLENVLHVEPFPSLADLFYLIWYPLMATGLLLLVRAHTPGRDRASFIDALIVTTGIGVLSWVFLMAPYATDASLTLTERLISIAYPLGDLLLLGVAVRLVVGGAARSPAFRMLAASLGLLLIADAIYGVQVLGSGYETGDPVDALWLLAYALVAATALHPSMRTLTEPGRPVQVRPSRARLLALGIASMIAPVTLGIEAARGRELDVPVIVGGSIVLGMLVMVRLGGLVREVETALVDLRQVEAERARLLDRTLRAAEEERSRIALELHNGPLQGLSALGYTLERGAIQLERGDAGKAAASLEQARMGFGEEIDGIRRMMSGLRPPALDERGLEAALRDQASVFEHAAGVPCLLSMECERRLPGEVETVLYRVAQEALLNVSKHARAREVHLSLTTNADGADLSILDDGVGFDVRTIPERVAQGHFGLAASRERVENTGGRWILRSSPGAGTLVRATYDGEVTS